MAWRPRTSLAVLAALLLGVALALGMGAAALAAAPPLLPLESAAGGVQSVQADYDPASRMATLVNRELRLEFSADPSSAGRLSVRRLAGWTPLVQGASTLLVLSDGSTLDLSRARLLGPTILQQTTEPGLGSGMRALLDVRLDAPGITARIEVTLFDRGPYFTYRVIIMEGAASARGFGYLYGTAFPGGAAGQATYLSDDDAIVEGSVTPTEVAVPVGQGKPLLLRSDDGAYGLLMALLDPSDAPSSFLVSAARHGVETRWQHGEIPGPVAGGRAVLPRLYVRVVDPRDLTAAFFPYRSLMRTLYPPSPPPPWLRHQWISWYLYGMDIDEGKLIAQIDYIAANLSDVGPWSLLIDAGWYMAEGRPEGDWRAVDSAKFPSGLRALVDYAHERNVRVVLYFSASCLNNQDAPGNWLGLDQIIERHRDWLVEIRTGDPWRTYYYDYSNPGFQDYLRGVLRDYFEVYGVDGIKVDGLEDGRLAQQRGLTRGFYSLTTRPVLPTASAYAFIYREAAALRPDVYVEAGWRMPAFSAPHFTVARQSDDTPDFGSRYPAPGLMGHVDYAIAQQMLLGQRPHLGNVWGDPNSNPIGLQWLDAGLGIDAFAALGFDLPSMSDRALSDYRSRLTQLRPFSATVRTSGGLRPDSFSAASEGTTFLALFNRGDEPREIRGEAAAHGFPPLQWLSAFDVGAGRPMAVRGSVIARVEPRSVRLFVLRSEPGILWTNSGFRTLQVPGSLVLEVTGPPHLGGFAYVAVPRPSAVLLNEEPLPPEAWSYDWNAGVLRVEYPHGSEVPTVVEIRY